MRKWNSDAGLNLELGLTRLFGQADLDKDGLVSGWANPEDQHTWNDGIDAVMTVYTSASGSACRLTFEGEPFLPVDVGIQDVVLFVNGFRVGFWRLREAKTYSLSAIIEPEQFFSRDDYSLLKLAWHIPRSVRPADVGLGLDTRELGFCFRSLTLE
jgi:hypothetical protein